MSERSVPPPEPEAIPAPRVLLTLLVTLLVFAASTVIVVFLEMAWTHGRSDYRHPEIPARLDREKINLLEQLPFSTGARAQSVNAATRLDLQQYGWSDKARGLAHEPVSLAMDALVKEAHP